MRGVNGREEDGVKGAIKGVARKFEDGGQGII